FSDQPCEFREASQAPEREAGNSRSSRPRLRACIHAQLWTGLSMTPEVRLIDDPATVLEEADVFLGGDPVRHNVILTLLNARVTSPERGRYWIVDVDGTPGGVVFQSPLDFFATITPMEPEAVVAGVDSIVD